MISLKDYIKRRNGVQLGHPKSLENMFKRSFGAKSFDMFWVHWNPIWSYYLNRYIYRPLNRIVHQYIAVILTFAISGFIHDLVGLLIYKKLSYVITLWFITMAFLVVLFKKYRLVYSKQIIHFKYIFNSTLILISFLITKVILN